MWRSYYATLPDRQEHYLAQICAMLANRWRGPKSKPYAPSDFAPDLRTPTERLAAERAFSEAEMTFAEMRKKAADRVANGSAS